MATASMKGACFCDQIRFEVTTKVESIYQCHCSECRKTTGAAANAGFMVSKGNFHWLAGEDNYQTFVKASGYCVNFCKTCGSPVPNETSIRANVIWIPAGLLEGDAALKVSDHIFVLSKAGWDEIGGNARLHDILPDDVSVLFPANKDS